MGLSLFSGRSQRLLTVAVGLWNPMRVFVYEYLCGGAPLEMPAGLRADGRAMLAALLEDLGRLPDVQPVALVARACGSGLPGEVVHLANGEECAFRSLVRQADATLVSAPEFYGLLETRCRWVEEEGRRLLGPSSAAVGLTADKLRLAEHLRARGVRTPPCVSATETALCFPAVLKPRDGTGSLATFLVEGAGHLSACLDVARADGWRGEMLLQSFVAGQPASVAFLLGPRQTLALAPAAQHLSADGRFHYHGGSVPLPPDLAVRAVDVARPAVEAVSGLHGYVGVDVVLGESSDGSQDWVIEINPRLTTSYLGLRVLAETNLAECLLRVAQGEEVPPPRWRPGRVEFRAI